MTTSIWKISKKMIAYSTVACVNFRKLLKVFGQSLKELTGQWNKNLNVDIFHGFWKGCHAVSCISLMPNCRGCNHSVCVSAIAWMKTPEFDQLLPHYRIQFSALILIWPKQVCSHYSFYYSLTAVEVFRRNRI